MKLQIETGKNISFHNLNGNIKYTIKKSKCRHYFINLFNYATGRYTAFKRVSLSALQNFVNLLIKARNDRKASFKAVEKTSVLKGFSSLASDCIVSLSNGLESLKKSFKSSFSIFPNVTGFK